MILQDSAHAGIDWCGSQARKMKITLWTFKSLFPFLSHSCHCIPTHTISNPEVKQPFCLTTLHASNLICMVSYAANSSKIEIECSIGVWSRGSEVAMHLLHDPNRSENEVTKLNTLLIGILVNDICSVLYTCTQAIHPMPFKVIFTANRARDNGKSSSFPSCSIHIIELVEGFIKTVVANQKITNASHLACWFAAFDQTLEFMRVILLMGWLCPYMLM